MTAPGAEERLGRTISGIRRALAPEDGGPVNVVESLSCLVAFQATLIAHSPAAKRAMLMTMCDDLLARQVGLIVGMGHA